ARRDNYSIKRADNSQLEEYQKRLKQRLDVMTPRFDLSVSKLAGLNEQRASSVIAYGAKSANLGEVIHAKLPGFTVPPGFTIPFYFYDQFLRENKFDDAGIYTSMPNLKTDEQLIDGIKSVWASVWNFEAYEARERAGIDHTKVYMAVLIQEGINSESSGVMITTDPFNRDPNPINKGSIYISAKRGLGMKVVEGQKIAEQVIFRPIANAVQVLTRSEEDSLLTFDESGGIKEIPIGADRMVLTDDVVRRLAESANR